MKNTILFYIFLFYIIFSTNTLYSKETKEKSNTTLEQKFCHVPLDIKTAVYWYWMGNNISQEGVIKDLQAMKKAGINRAYIGIIGMDKGYTKKIKVMSEEWWKILHTALKTATDLDIEIGIFNGPGWSQSGGPWVKPEQGMKYLATSSVIVEGGKGKKTISLPMDDRLNRLKVLAFPLIEEDKREWSVFKNSEKELEVIMEASFKNARTIIFKTNSSIKTTAKLYEEVEDNVSSKEWKFVKSFVLDRSRYRLRVGFDPFAPITISIPENNSNKYKIVFDKEGEGNLEICLTTKPYIENYAEKTFAKMFMGEQPMWKDYMWEKQPEISDKGVIVQPRDVIDLTSKVEGDGVLPWNVPAGKWKIMMFSMKHINIFNAPAASEACGIEVDKMSKKYINEYFNSYIGEILRRIPAQDRKSFKIVVMDSYERGGSNWTDDMAEVFKQKYGYDPIPFIPAMSGEVIGSADMSNKFLWDLRRLVADRVAHDYVGGLREISNKNGLTTWLENYGHWGFPAEFLQYGGQSDEVAGEFWSEGYLGNIENRAASSCAHIYGKPKVWAESFTASGKDFFRYPYLMKQRGDRFFTEGINSTLLHVYIQQPDDINFPGTNAWFGNEFNRKNTWFKQIDLFTNYLKRCNMMLQEGRYIADVAYFIGEDTPKMTGITDPKLPIGYSYDYINAEVLLNQAKVENGLLTLDSGMKYKLLVLPKLETMTPELLEKIKNMVNQGLVILGPEPKRSPSLKDFPNADKKVATMAQALWGKNNMETFDKTNRVNRYGKGKVYDDGVSIEKIFSDMKLSPDFITNDCDSILYIHRQCEDCDIYFISNQTEKKVAFTSTFRINGISPELWDPLTAGIRDLPEYTLSNGRTSIPIKLNPLESAFIVFKKSNTISTHDNKNIKKNENFPEARTIANINSNWNVKFGDNFNKFEKSISMKKLNSWTTLKDKQLKYYSGSAVYTSTFNLSDNNIANITLSEKNGKDEIKIYGNRILVDLGKVMVMAKIKINGQYAGGVWTPPYRIDITDYIKKGKNTIEVEVVNNWVNRIIGDMNLPEEKRSTSMVYNPWKADSPLQESGLIGPVRVMSIKY